MYANIAEILAALRDLSDTDYVRLYEYARRKMHGTHDCPEDLVSDAIASAFLAAQDEGGRHWPMNKVPFVIFLMMTMRGLAWDERRSLHHRMTCSGHFISGGLEPSNLASGFPLPSCSQSPPDLLIAQEDHMHKQGRDHALLKQVHERFSSDRGVQWIIFGIQEGLPARTIKEMSGMSNTEWATAQKRWNRGLNQLFPGRKDALGRRNT
jgi:hypothetical protein